jgi:hypothetical protein
MTRSNVYVTLTGGIQLFFVLDGSTAPEQGFIVERFIHPLLALSDLQQELEFIYEHSDSFHELRVNADYRYEINLVKKTVGFFEENYHSKADTFHKGKDLTEERYIPYENSLKTAT